MTLTKALAPIAIASTVAGGVLSAPVVHATHVDVSLLAGTAFFVGPTILSTPSPTFAQSAVDLYLRPLGFDVGGGDLDACHVGAVDCDAPLRLLTTPALVQQGHSSFVGAAEIVRAVHAELDANPGAYDADNPLWIFGWSQGATAGSIAMAQLAHDDVDPELLHFVFIGDPVERGGAWQDMVAGASSGDFLDTSLLSGVHTPNDAFQATVYTIPGDPVADPSSTSALGLLYEHMMYLGLTPDQVTNHAATIDGMLTDISISGDFDQFGAWLNAWPHGLVDSGWWEGLFYSLVASFYSAFGNIEDFFGDWLGVDWGGVEDTLDFWFPAEA